MTSAPNRSPGRPRLFDEEKTLDELTAVFWQKGYSNTSMADLVEASGVHKSSLYSTFGSKDELFATVLRRYMASRMETFSTLIARAGPGIDGIHSFLEMLCRDAADGSNQNGCLLVASSSELCGTTPGFENFGPQYRQALRDQLRKLVASVESETNPNHDITERRTNLLLGFLLGLDVATRGRADAGEIGLLIDGMHGTVDTWQTTPHQ